MGTKQVQVLIATMNQTDHNLLEKMNIQSPAIVGNQCSCNEIEEFDYNGNLIKWLSFAERGVGLNRNNSLMRATEDFLIFADDDMVFDDGYATTVIQLFDANPRADILIFNLPEEGEQKGKENKLRKFIILKKSDMVRDVWRVEEVVSNKKVYFLIYILGAGQSFHMGKIRYFCHSVSEKNVKFYVCQYQLRN